MLKPPTIPGEFEVACLPDVVHLNSVESITGVVAGSAGGGNQGATDSFVHASASAQSSPTFWRGSLYLSNYQLSFVVAEGLAAGTHALGYCSSPLPHSLASKGSADLLDPALLAAHPNADPANHVLLHVPVGSVFKMDYGKYVAEKGSSAAAAKENAASSKDKDAGKGGDYSSFSGDSYSKDSVSAAAAAADSTLRDIAYQLTIVCRDARVLSFGILRKTSSVAESPSHAHAAAAASTPAPLERQSTTRGEQPSTEDRQASVAEFLRLLKKYAWPREVRKLFAFSYGAGTLGSAKQGAVVPGWQCYDVVREFARQGVGCHPADASLGLSLAYPRRKAAWRLDVTSNARFEFCPSYPQAFWLPLELTDKELGKVKSFRSKSRIPALVFNYSDLLDYASLGLSQQAYPDTVILRAAQPNVGWTFGRCTADERLLELAGVRVIIDARPYANAVANQAKGGGFENAENYKSCRIQFMNIENIHVMRESLAKMLELLRTNAANNYNTGQSSSGDEFWIGLQQSGWLKHVRILLEGAIVCATYVRNGASILIHCSDGWDRTSQLTSLSQIILDPFYRTKAGFAILVEKEWVSFGHQWAKRCGHGLKDSIDGTERSPIFFQFLDAVWQIQTQFPFSFEFNAEYLSAIADHIYSNKFGTFLHDNERLRTLDHIKHTTQSLWTEINSEANAQRFKNGLYGKGGVAKPSNSAASAGAGALGVVPNNPSMNLTALSGADLGRAAFLHVVADPRRVAIWPYWFRWERRKQNHPVQHAAMVPQAHLHHSSAPAVTHFTLAQQARLVALENTVGALEADAQRMDALLRTQAQADYDAKLAKGEQPEALPASFRRIHINAATKIWEGQFPQGHAHGHGHGHAHHSNGGKVIPPPPPPQQKKTTGASASASSSSGSGSAPTQRKTRVGSANNRGSIILTDGRQARGSIMNFGGNPLATTSEGADDDFAEGIELEPNPAAAAAAAVAAGASSTAASTDSSASSSSSSAATTAAPASAPLGSGQFPKRVMVNPKAKQSSGQVLSGKPLPAASNPRLRQQATLKAAEAKEAMAAANAAAGGTGVTAAGDAGTPAASGAAAGAASTASPAAPAAAAHGIVHRPRGLSKWNRFTDPASGNPYWHDSITGTTTWNPPVTIAEGGSTSGAGAAGEATALPMEDFESEADATSAAAAAAARASVEANPEPTPVAAVEPAAAVSSTPAAEPVPAAAAATPAAAAVVAVPIVAGPLGPQFRISAAAFQGVKLKSTARRFDVAAAAIGAPAPAPQPEPAPQPQPPVQPQIPAIPDQLPPPLDDDDEDAAAAEDEDEEEGFVSEGDGDESADELLPPAPAAPLLFIAQQSGGGGGGDEEEVCLPPPPAPPAAVRAGSFSASSSNSAPAEEAAELQPLPSPPQPPQ